MHLGSIFFVPGLVEFFAAWVELGWVSHLRDWKTIIRSGLYKYPGQSQVCSLSAAGHKLDRVNEVIFYGLLAVCAIPLNNWEYDRFTICRFNCHKRNRKIRL